MVLNLYAYRDDIKARLGLEDTIDDGMLDLVLSSVSREIDSFCGRHFFAAVQTRYYQTRYPGNVLLGYGDDLLSVTSLTTDDDGDRTYGTTWTATDYDLEPVNAPYQSPPSPFWKLRVAPNGDYCFPTVERGVKVTGLWGYYNVLQTSTATLAEDLDTSETGVDVSSGTAFKVGQIVVIDSERLEITAISTNTLTVTRAVNGTTAATHSNGAAISVAQYPIVAEAALHQAILEYRGSTAAPLGVQGSPEYGQVIRSVGLHPFVQKSLAPFRVPRAG